MRRVSMILLAVVLAAIGATTARAQSSAHRVGQSPGAVRAYWTPARMKAAVPADRVRAARGPAAKPQKPGGSTYPYTSYEVTSPYTAAPTSTHGKVFFTERGTNYVCSGTALTSANRSTVWTAGHCVNEGPGAYVTNWSFVPAYKDGAAPLGKWPATTLATTDRWRTAGDFGFDLGAAVVAPNTAGQALTDVTGGRGIRFNYDPAAFRFLSYGYPAASPFNGQRLWVCDAPLGTRDTSVSPATMGIGCNMTGGSSGGGWMVGSDVVSVNSYGYTRVKNVMYGPYQGSVAQSLYDTASR
jgi:V8-like Glu-specific endopeptidase